MSGRDIKALKRDLLRLPPSSRRRRRANPERWLAPKLSARDRARLAQLHEVYFPMFTEVEGVPGDALETDGGRYTLPEGYALRMQVGPQEYLFFQDPDPADTWTFVELGADQDAVEQLDDYLSVLERINEAVIRHVRRRPNLTTDAVAADAVGVTLGDELAGPAGAIAGGLLGHEVVRLDRKR